MKTRRRGFTARARKSGAEFERGVLRAYSTVGTTPEARFRWLIGFAERDVGDSSDPQGFRYEVDCFNAGQQDARLDRDPSAPLDPFNIGATEPADVPPIQKALRECLVQLREKRRFTFTVPRRQTLALGKSGAVVIREGEPLEQFLAETLDLLVALAPRLGVCVKPDCRRLFVATRPHQTFCTTRCSNRDRLARFRIKHPGKRHTQYENQVKAKLGANVKVAGRPRKKA